jgi:glycosyltransferase involved in cell wall biosynthesis
VSSLLSSFFGDRGETLVATFDVLLPVRNGISFLHEAVDSIRNQTFSDWRLLILDHGSQDGSLELSQRYAEEDTRIKAFAFPTADGLADLLNQGLEMCDCKYMLRQDADDISLPNRMSIVKDRIGDNPDIVAIGSDVFAIDKTGRQIAYRRLPTSPMAVTAATFFYNPMAHPTIAASFAALKRYGARYGVDILHAVSEADSLTVKQLAEDYFLYGQLALLGLCANVGLPLVKCRRHSGSVGAKNLVRQTGKKAIVLNAPAMAVLAGLPRIGAYVIAGQDAGTDKEKPRRRPQQAMAVDR